MKALETRGRTLNYAAHIYDFCHDKIPACKMDVDVRQRFLEVEDFSLCTRRPANRERGDEVETPIDRRVKVLDVGCGTGTLTIEIAKKLKGQGEVIGIDAAPNMIKVANKKAKTLTDGISVGFHAELAEDLPYEADSFDFVVNTMFIHHLPYDLKQKAFDEMYRVLKDGGKLWTVDVDKPTTLFGALAGYAGFIFFMQKAIYENLQGILRRLIEEAGFEDVRLVDHRYGLVSLISAMKAKS